METGQQLQFCPGCFYPETVSSSPSHILWFWAYRNRSGSSGDPQLTRTSLYLTFFILSAPSQSPGPGCMVLTLSVRTVSRAEGWSRAHKEVTLL